MKLEWLKCNVIEKQCYVTTLRMLKECKVQDHHESRHREIDINKNISKELLNLFRSLVSAQKRAISRLPSVKKSLNHTDKRGTIWRIRMQPMLHRGNRMHTFLSEFYIFQSCICMWLYDEWKYFWIATITSSVKNIVRSDRVIYISISLNALCVKNHY